MTAEAESSTGQADEGGTVRAAAMLVDAWAPALRRSYHLGRRDGYAAGQADEREAQARDFTVLAQHVRTGASTPQLAALRELRSGNDHSPCRQNCGACSQCFHAASYAERGGRPFLGAEAEARFAAEASGSGA